jgi:hypothetical protein
MLMVRSCSLKATSQQDGEMFLKGALTPRRRRRDIARIVRLSVTENDAGHARRAFDLILRGIAEPFRQMFQNRDVFAAGGTSALFPLRRTGALTLRTPEPRDETVST